MHHLAKTSDDLCWHRQPFIRVKSLVRIIMTMAPLLPLLCHPARTDTMVAPASTHRFPAATVNWTKPPSLNSSTALPYLPSAPPQQTKAVGTTDGPNRLSTIQNRKEGHCARGSGIFEKHGTKPSATKMMNVKLHGIHRSPNYPVLAGKRIHIKYNNAKSSALKQRQKRREITETAPLLDTNVVVLKFFWVFRKTQRHHL